MKSLHRKWIIWTGVVLMLIGMIVYVITLDESEPLPLPEPTPAPEQQ